MAKAPFQDDHGPPTEPGLRIILRRLREIIEEPGDGQSRLDKIVRQIAGLMVAGRVGSGIAAQLGSIVVLADGANPALRRDPEAVRRSPDRGRQLLDDTLWLALCVAHSSLPRIVWRPVLWVDDRRSRRTPYDPSVGPHAPEDREHTAGVRRRRAVVVVEFHEQRTKTEHLVLGESELASGPAAPRPGSRRPRPSCSSGCGTRPGCSRRPRRPGSRRSGPGSWGRRA